MDRWLPTLDLDDGSSRPPCMEFDRLYEPCGVTRAARRAWGLRRRLVRRPPPHEIGLRMVMGAQRFQLFGYVLRQALIPTMIGIGIGLAVSVAISRVLTAYLFGIAATDPETYVAVTALMTLVIVTACLVPARRAMRIDPVVALRN